MITEAALSRLRDLVGGPEGQIDRLAGGDPAIRVEPSRIQEVARICKEDPDLQYNALSFVTGVDREDHIDLVYFLTSLVHRGRLVLKVKIDRQDPEVDTVSGVWQTANWHERECFDLLGVRFKGHPDLRRLLMPDDWPGYPLRKDYQQAPDYHGIVKARTAQIPSSPEAIGTADWMKVDLKSLAELRPLHQPAEGEMVLNMGPHHPSTHGVLNFVLITDGEVMHRAIPHVGYLHRGIEKLAEGLEYPSFMPFTDRVDYLGAMAANQGYAMAVEKLLGCDVPPRAEHLRVIVCELNRIASHLIATGSQAMDLGAVTPFLQWIKEREYLNDMFEALCGARLTFNYMRIGGVAADAPEGWKDWVLRWLDHFESMMEEFDRLITGNEIFVQRMANIAAIPPEEAVDFGLVGPNLRASGVDWDLRRDEPYSAYPGLEFDVPLGKGSRGKVGDCYDRFEVRLQEMRQSCRIVRQAFDRLPEGEVRAKLPRKLSVPEGEAYARVEAPRGELGFYLVSRGGDKPYRLKIRTGSFSAMSIVEKLSPGVMIADLVAILGSLDVIAPEVDR